MNARPDTSSLLVYRCRAFRFWTAFAWLGAGVYLGALETGAHAAEPPAATPAAGDEKPTSQTRAQQLAVLAASLRDFRAKKDWENVAATHEEILSLEPNNAKLRRFVAWDLSYNISAEIEDVGKRYEWIRRGILVLIDGIDNSAKDARLCWDAGWFIAQKLGRSDERRQFRRLFAADEKFHQRIGRHVAVARASGPDGKPDNWLVGRLFFLRAIELGQREGASIRDVSPLMYYSDPAMCRIQFASALVEEGHSGQTAVRAWQEGEREWKQTGDREIATAYGFSIRLNDRNKHRADAAKLWKEFDRLQPGLRDRLRDEATKALPEPQRRALQTPPEKRTDNQWDLAAKAEVGLRLSPEILSARVQGAGRAEALRIGRQALDADRRAAAVGQYGEIVNYDYWLRRCRIERSDVVLQARQLAFRAAAQLDKGRLDSTDSANPGARQLYEQAFGKWAEALGHFENLIDDEYVCQDVMAVIGQYRRAILGGKPLPGDFPLRKVVDRWGARPRHGEGP